MMIVFLTAVVWGTLIVEPANASDLESNKIGVFSSCFPTYIEISFLLDSLTGVNLSTLHLRSPLCKSTRNSTHVTFKAPLFECETRLIETSENDYTFDNVVQGVKPSINVRCVYPKEYIIGKYIKENEGYSVTAQLTMYQDSQLSRHIPPGGVVRFESSIPQDLFFDLQIIPSQKNMSACLFVKFCGLLIQNKVLSLIEKGQEIKMTTQVIFTSAERITFKFNASLLVTSISLNTKLKLFCLVSGYHDNSTHENKGCNGNHGDKHHGNASDCQVLKERQDYKDTGRNSTHCNCEQDRAPMADDHVNQRRAGCDVICVSGSKVQDHTSDSSHIDRKPRRKRAVKEQSLLSVLSQEKNNTVQSSNYSRHIDRDSRNPSPNDISHKMHLCSSSEWNGKPVLLQVEREWVAKPSIRGSGSKWTEKHDSGHLSRNMTNASNTTKVTQTVWSTERIPSAALLLACSYLSLLLVIGPMLLIYLWDRRNQKKRRRHKQRTRYARGYSGARLLLTREQSVA